MKCSPPRGVTLLETVLYIGLIAILLPAFIIFVQQVWQQQIGFDARLRLEQTTALTFLEMTHAITEASAILVSTSTLGTDASILRFQDKNGTEVLIEHLSTTVAFSETNQTVRRLRLQRGNDDPVWLTEPEHDVTQWRVDPVRDESGILTGLRLQFAAELLNASGNVYRNAVISTSTTFALSPQTGEN